ncbi:MAG: thiamine-phosphate diphosphorylase [Paenibacillaceae bacterium ZCTH02-B3]|nr:MAG: thiamine-phosphate diphosphorylase [Paenibacillaceae bacterium ZCTH02-B3]
MTDGAAAKLRLYFVMGTVNCAGRDPQDVLSQAIDGGVTVFQYREKGRGALRRREAFALGERLRMLCLDRGVPFIVNDDLELALVLDADGLHVGQEDLAAETAREKIGGKWLGVSVSSLDEAVRAMRAGADYLGAGPIFDTKTKEDAKPGTGPDLIRRIREAGIDLPVVGIGGINPANAGLVMEAGADGIAVISAISQAPSPAEAARELRRAIGAAEKFR